MAASELTALAAAMARLAYLPMLQRWRTLPTAIAAVAKVDHSDTASSREVKDTGPGDESTPTIRATAESKIITT